MCAPVCLIMCSSVCSHRAINVIDVVRYNYCHYCYNIFTAGGVLLFVTRKLDSEQVAANLQIQGYSGVHIV